MKISTFEHERFNQLYASVTNSGNMMYVGDLLQSAAQRLPEHPALIFEGKSYSYRYLYTKAVAFSKMLLEHNVKPHDRVLLLKENTPEYYIAYFGILQIGAVIAPLNTFLKEPELAHIIKDSQPAAIVAGTEFVPLLERTGVPLPPIMTEKDVHQIPDSAAMPTFSTIKLPERETAALLYTSGTTGMPKGVMLSSYNIMMNIIQGVARFELLSQDRIFAVLPLFHAFAQNTYIWAPLFIGSTVILVRKIDRHHILAGLEQKPTIFVGVPALYGLLALLRTAPVQSVRLFLSGGDVLPDKIRSVFELIYRRKICSGYGLTETSPFVSGDVSEETVITTNVGRPLIGIEASYRDDQGKELPANTIGQLWLKGPNIMLGYYNAPEMTAAVIQDGWLNTGDLAYKDSKGRIVITGRMKDIIKHKGFIIYPPEIENVIMTHPNVLQVGVIGKPDVQTGEIPVAFVQLRKDEPDIKKALHDLCVKNLASYKVPRAFICSTNPLPATATGKIDKKKLRAELAQSHKNNE